MTAPTEETTKLRAWVKSTPDAPKYVTAYLWMNRNKATAEQTIEYYTNRYKMREATVEEKCEKAGVSYSAVRHRIYRDGWTADQAIAYYLAKKQKQPAPNDIWRLKKFCEENGISYGGAKSYRCKHKLTVDQTIAYYQSDRETLASMCRRYEVSLSAAEAYKYRTGCSKREAIDHCLKMAEGGKPTPAKKAAKEYGVDVKRVYYVMNRDNCSAEVAAQKIAEQDGIKKPVEQVTVNKVLTRAWI